MAHKHSTTFPVSVPNPGLLHFDQIGPPRPFPHSSQHGSAPHGKSDSVRVHSSTQHQPHNPATIAISILICQKRYPECHADPFPLCRYRRVTGSQTGRRSTFLVQRRGNGMLTEGGAEMGAGKWTLCHRVPAHCLF